MEACNYLHGSSRARECFTRYSRIAQGETIKKEVERTTDCSEEVAFMGTEEIAESKEIPPEIKPPVMLDACLASIKKAMKSSKKFEAGSRLFVDLFKNYAAPQNVHLFMSAVSPFLELPDMNELEKSSHSVPTTAHKAKASAISEVATKANKLHNVELEIILLLKESISEWLKVDVYGSDGGRVVDQEGELDQACIFEEEEEVDNAVGTGAEMTGDAADEIDHTLHLKAYMYYLNSLYIGRCLRFSLQTDDSFQFSSVSKELKACVGHPVTANSIGQSNNAEQYDVFVPVTLPPAAVAGSEADGVEAVFITPSLLLAHRLHAVVSCICVCVQVYHKMQWAKVAVERLVRFISTNFRPLLLTLIIDDDDTTDSRSSLEIQASTTAAALLRVFDDLNTYINQQQRKRCIDTEEVVVQGVSIVRSGHRNNQGVHTTRQENSIAHPLRSKFTGNLR